MATLAHLPFELLTDILVESHNGHLFSVCRKMHAVMRGASNTVRARYLFNSWKNYYLNNPKQKRRQCILDFCICFRICNAEVLKLLNTWIVDDGIADGLFCVEQHLRTHMDGRLERCVTPKAFFVVNELPRRLFKQPAKGPSCTYPDGFDAPLGFDELFGSYHQDSHTSLAWPLRCALSHIADADKASMMPVPDLLLLLSLLCLHSRASQKEGTMSLLANSHRGYALARAAFERNFGLCSLLLAVGANPDVAISVACRMDWLEGLQLLTRKNEKEQVRWERAIRIIRMWTLDRYEEGLGDRPSPLLAQRFQEVRLTGYKDDVHNGDETGEDDQLYRRPRAAHYALLRERPSPKRTRHSARGEVRGLVTQRNVIEAFEHDAETVAKYMLDRMGIDANLEVINAMERFASRKARRIEKERKRDVDGGSGDNDGDDTSGSRHKIARVA